MLKTIGKCCKRFASLLFKMCSKLLPIKQNLVRLTADHVQKTGRFCVSIKKLVNYVEEDF